MKNAKQLLLLLLVSLCAFASRASVVYVNNAETIEYIRAAAGVPWSRSTVRIQELSEAHGIPGNPAFELVFTAGVDAPDQAYVDSITPEDLALLQLPPGHVKIVDNRLVALTQGELDALAAAEAAAFIAAEAARQAAKPLEQKQYENMFFALTEQLLAALEDPRAGQEPPVKLSFPEIDAILEQLFVADLATATRASIRLLGIDAALKRYNMLWWDDAIQHTIPEE